MKIGFQEDCIITPYGYILKSRKEGYTDTQILLNLALKWPERPANKPGIMEPELMELLKPKAEQ